jgi:hypothetical protein
LVHAASVSPHVADVGWNASTQAAELPLQRSLASTLHAPPLADPVHDTEDALNPLFVQPPLPLQ